MDKFKEPQRVFRGLSAVLLGVIVYCSLLAPLVREGNYWEIAKESLSTIGLGFGVAIVVVGVVWHTIIYFINKKD